MVMTLRCEYRLPKHHLSPIEIGKPSKVQVDLSRQTIHDIHDIQDIHDIHDIHAIHDIHDIHALVLPVTFCNRLGWIGPVKIVEACGK